MNARDEILSSIRMRQVGKMARPSQYRAASVVVSLDQRFAERATAEAAEVRFLDRMEDVPAAASDILRARNLAATVHLPFSAWMNSLPWNTGLVLDHTPPGPNDAALAVAPFAVAETGTLVYASAPNAPPSWHFRPGLEIAVISARNILPRLEDVVMRLRKDGAIASTVNLVTGPSRTGDIEQTLELGAHGPKALSILIVKE